MRSGWFKESHRHSLAAKGIKTNRYFKQKTYLMGQYRISQKALREIPDKFKEEATRMLIKGVPAKEVVRRFTGRDDFVEREMESSGMRRSWIRVNSPEEAIEVIMRVGQELGRPPRTHDMAQEGYSIYSLARHYKGSFPAAVQAAADKAREETPETVDDPKLLWFQGHIRTREIVPVAQRLGLDMEGNEIELTPEQIAEARAEAERRVTGRKDAEMRAFLLKQQLGQLEEEVEDLKKPFTEGTIGMDVAPEILETQRKELEKKEAELKDLKSKASKEYMAYKFEEGGVDKEDAEQTFERLDRFFEANPRERLKRDKSVKNIEVEALIDPEKRYIRPIGAFETENDTIFLANPVIKQMSDKELGELLSHELTHAVQNRKLGKEKMDDDFYKSKRLHKVKLSKRLEYPWNQVKTAYEDLGVNYHDVSPIERYAEWKRKNQPDVQRYNQYVKMVPELQERDRRFKQNMRAAKNIREFEDIWE
jgi:hypothetical protein